MSEQKSLINTIVAGLIGGVIAAVVNAILFFVAGAVSGPLIAELPDATIGPVALPFVMVASIVPAIFAAILLWLLQRFMGNGTRIFQIIAVVFLVLSFFSPFSAAQSTATALWLTLMHLVAGGAIIWSLTMR